MSQNPSAFPDGDDDTVGFFFILDTQSLTQLGFKRVGLLDDSCFGSYSAQVFGNIKFVDAFNKTPSITYWFLVLVYDN